MKSYNDLQNAIKRALTRNLIQQRKSYVDSWMVNGESFRAEGHYDWMEGFIKNKRRVLEIGIGCGHSTACLLNHGHVVIGIEENPECLSAAKALLENEGAHLRTYFRSSIETIDTKTFKIVYAPIAPLAAGIESALFEADLTEDPHFLTWINSIGPVDAIVCWLVGTNPGSASKKRAKAVRTSEDYRSIIQENLYELASRILTQDGFLHLVDRISLAGVAEVAEKELSDYRDYHCETARKFSLQVMSATTRPYEEAIKGVLMVKPDTPFDPLPAGTSTNRHLVSIVVSR